MNTDFFKKTKRISQKCKNETSPQILLTLQRTYDAQLQSNNGNLKSNKINYWRNVTKFRQEDKNNLTTSK